MAHVSASKQDRLSAEIRRQFGDRSAVRFAHTLPTFKVAAEIPEHLRTLLEKLQSTEENARDGHR